MSDVKLVNGQVVVEAWDLCVDAPDRRKKATPHRRALVHDHDDGLTVNYGNDYPGGVTLNSTKKIEGFQTDQWGRTIHIDTNSLILGAESILASAAKLITFGNKMEIAGEVKFKNDTRFLGKIKLVFPGDRRVRATEIDLGEAISKLQAEVANLKTKISAIENKIG